MPHIYVCYDNTTTREVVNNKSGMPMCELGYFAELNQDPMESGTTPTHTAVFPASQAIIATLRIPLS